MPKGSAIRQFLLITFLLVVFGMILSGGANAQEHHVPLDLASAHAVVAFMETVVWETSSLIRGEGTEEWYGGMIREPLVLFDITREPLFYSFPVLLENGAMVGRIWVSASKVLGPSAASVIMGPRTWSMEDATARVEEAAMEAYPGWEIVSLQIIVYSYPKIGVLVTIRDPRTGGEARIIMDVADGTIIPDVEPEADVRGTGSWSFYESIPREEWAERIGRWEADNEWVNMVVAHLREAGIEPMMLMERPFTVHEWMIPKEVFGDLTSCEVCIVNGGIPAPGGINQFCQQTGVWCTVATGQMIAAFYGVHHTQAYIASVMGTSTSGTFTLGELGYFKDSKKGLGKACSDYDRTTNDWNEFSSEICAGRPFDSSIKGHSRVAAGVRWCQTPTGTKRYIGIVDPSPPKKGCGERWDDWDTVKLMEHVWVRDCP